MATRAEPGVVSFDWARNLANPNEIILVVAFTDAAAGAVHVDSTHTRAGIARLPDLLSGAPEIVHANVGASAWSTMREFVVREPRQVTQAPHD